MDKPLRNFSIMLEALSELRPEIEAANITQEEIEQKEILPAAPTLDEALSELGPIPREALLLGLASDGLPVLLNLHNPHPGPLLVVADPGAGKTAFLQLLAQAMAEVHTPADIKFGVVTNYPDEWEHLVNLEHCAGIFPTYHNSAMDYLHSLSEWAHSNKGSDQSVLLLVDDLESMDQIDGEAGQAFRWLLLRGPARRVWPIVTLNSERASQVRAWLEAFRTRVFGQITDDRIADKLSGVANSELRHLQAGLQFALRQDDDWLKFWIPETGSHKEGEE